jgi:hypothetical protein
MTFIERWVMGDFRFDHDSPRTQNLGLFPDGRLAPAKSRFRQRQGLAG